MVEGNRLVAIFVFEEKGEVAMRDSFEYLKPSLLHHFSLEGLKNRLSMKRRSTWKVPHSPVRSSSFFNEENTLPSFNESINTKVGFFD